MLSDELNRTEPNGTEPGLLSLEEFAIGGDLELKTEFAVHDRLQLAQNRLHFGTQLHDLHLELVVLSLQLAFAFLFLAAQVLQFTLERRALHTPAQSRNATSRVRALIGLPTVKTE